MLLFLDKKESKWKCLKSLALDSENCLCFLGPLGLTHSCCAVPALWGGSVRGSALYTEALVAPAYFKPRAVGL